MILYLRRVIILFLIFFSILSSSGQDAYFSQFYANPLYLNPAFAGTVNCPRFTLNFRDQWPAIKRNFVTFSGSYDQHIYAIHGGIGVLATADIQGGGIFQTYNIGAIYNFRVQISNQFCLQLAFQGSYFYNSLNWDKLLFASDLVNSYTLSDLPKDQSSDLKKSQFDASIGIVGYTPYLYFGLAVHHLLPLQMSFFRNSSDKFKTIWEPKWTAHVGGKIIIKQKMKDEVNFGDIFIYPNIVFISQGNCNYLHEGFYFNFYPFTIGSWLRHSFKNFEAFIISCGVEYKIFRIGYSYDFSLTKLEKTGGAHEVSLQFMIPCNPEKMKKSAQRKNTRFSAVACPTF
ncbi:MAG: PorP/SprF family type IX secretion system membrane protein [Bacteroidales bacterium]|jgi:type IX secretion system PorP/SprF family membrane protein|nr:PorP/SprF family type IX secretion system membrane protein [Bacteroidales bacterium]